jgi:hypothetical protein
MTKLEDFLDKNENGKIDLSIYQKYKDFEYLNEDIFTVDLNFLLENIYNIKIYDESRKRLSQQEFRNKLMELYNYKCIVTGDKCIRELTACHIIPFAEDENYDLDNGLVLKESIHRTFDDFFWSINPETLKIEINKNIDECGEIKEYEDKEINLEINSEIKENLKWHHNNFIKNKN